MKCDAVRHMSGEQNITQKNQDFKHIRSSLLLFFFNLHAFILLQCVQITAYENAKIGKINK